MENDLQAQSFSTILLKRHFILKQFRISLIGTMINHRNHNEFVSHFSFPVSTCNRTATGMSLLHPSHTMVKKRFLFQQMIISVPVVITY